VNGGVLIAPEKKKIFQRCRGDRGGRPDPCWKAKDSKGRATEVQKKRSKTKRERPGGFLLDVLGPSLGVWVYPWGSPSGRTNPVEKNQGEPSRRKKGKPIRSTTSSVGAAIKIARRENTKKTFKLKRGGTLFFFKRVRTGRKGYIVPAWGWPTKTDCGWKVRGKDRRSCTDRRG